MPTVTVGQIHSRWTECSRNHLECLSGPWGLWEKTKEAGPAPGHPQTKQLAGRHVSQEL